MPTGRFKYEKLTKYPHLKPEDILTWEKFIDLVPAAYDSVDYDFALGQVPEATTKAQELEIPGAEKVFRYKADVIGYAPERIDIIELKDKANPTAIGQTLSEKMLYDRDEKPTVPTRAVIIAREATPELHEIADKYGVRLILV